MKFSPILVMLLFAASALAQQKEQIGDRKWRREGTHNGNLVETLFWNFGEVAWWGKQPSGVWPRGTGRSYMDGITPIVAAEVVTTNGDTIHMVEAGYRELMDYSPTGVERGWQPRPGFFNPNQDEIAMSTNPNSWPEMWTDRPPSWAGKWNGYFGQRTNADQESYFVIDDQADDGHSFYPDSTNKNRRGLGLRVGVRGFQWSNVLAQDIIFWHYEITNESTTPYDKIIFGMYVDSGVGGQFDSNDDNALYDLDLDLTYTWDTNGLGEGGWGPTGYAGYAFLESPGNPLNGIDDDGDGRNGSGPVFTQVDLDRATAPRQLRLDDQLVVVDYDSYQRTVATLKDSIVTYQRGRRLVLRPGTILPAEIAGDGFDNNFNGLLDEAKVHLELKYLNYVTGEGIDNPLIDERRDDGVDNDKDWDRDRDDVGEDGVAGSGDRGEGDGLPTLGEPNFDRTDVDESDQIGLTAFDVFYIGSGVSFRDDESIWQRISLSHFDTQLQNGNIAFLYGSGPFPLPPGKTERFSLALVFAGNLDKMRRNKETVQKIYNANYNFARPPDKPKVWAVAGDRKVTLYWDDLAERSYDVFSDPPEDFEGYKIYKSTDPAFNDSYIVTDGFGNKSLSKPAAQFDIRNNVEGFFPIAIEGVQYYLGDNKGLRHSWTDTSVVNGRTYYYAVVSYDRGEAAKNMLPSECTKVIVRDVAGKVTLDQNTVMVTPNAPAAGYESAQLPNGVVHRRGPGTGAVWVDIVDPRLARDGGEYRVVFDDTSTRTTRYSLYRLKNDGSSEAVFENSPYINGEDANHLFDGLRLFVRDDTVRFNADRTGWTQGDANLQITGELLRSYPTRREGFPARYEVRVGVQDTSWLFNSPQFTSNFQVWDVVSGNKVRYYLRDATGQEDSLLNAGDFINIWIKEGTRWFRLWKFDFIPPLAGETRNPEAGDVAYIHIDMPFRSGDVFEFQTLAPKVSTARARQEMDRIAVVPNPYLAAAEWEPTRLLASGRGDRKIDFIHLPSKCTIRVFTISGQLVQTLEHDSAIDDGAESWNLRTRDGMDAAPGVYIFHVESPVGEKLGKLAIVK